KRAHYSTLAMTKQPFARYGLSVLIPLQQQALKVLAFWEFDAHGMVGRGAIPLAQHQRRARVGGRARDDLLEQLRRYAPGTGEGREQPSRPEKLQGVQVDILVSACGARRVLGGRRELRRVEHDEIELPAVALQPPQRLEDIRLQPFGARGWDASQGEVAPRPAARL